MKELRVGDSGTRLVKLHEKEGDDRIRNWRKRATALILTGILLVAGMIIVLFSRWGRLDDGVKVVESQEQMPEEEWTRQLDEGHIPVGVNVGKDGSAYVTSVEFIDSPSGVIGGRRAVFDKYDSQGSRSWCMPLDKELSIQAPVFALGEAGMFTVAYATWDSLTGVDTSNILVTRYMSPEKEEWSTVLSGSGSDGVAAMTGDASGNLYLTGITSSSDFGSREYGTKANASYDVFLSKVNGSGQSEWTTCLRGGMHDQSTAICLDGAGDIYIAGHTGSLGFPVVGAGSGSFIDGLPNTQSCDIFVAKFSADGQLIWSSIIGGKGQDFPKAILASNDGRIRIVGDSTSPDFIGSSSTIGKPNRGRSSFLNAMAFAWSRKPNILHSLLYGVSPSPSDGVILSLDKEGTLLSTEFLGGTGMDVFTGAAGDEQGNIYVCGFTFHAEDVPGMKQSGARKQATKDTKEALGLPTIPSITIPGPVTGRSAIVMKLDVSGAVLWATDMGFPKPSEAVSLALDQNGMFVVGIAGDTGPGGNAKAQKAYLGRRIFIQKKRAD